MAITSPKVQYGAQLPSDGNMNRKLDSLPVLGSRRQWPSALSLQDRTLMRLGTYSPVLRRKRRRPPRPRDFRDYLARLGLAPPKSRLPTVSQSRLSAASVPLVSPPPERLLSSCRTIEVKLPSIRSPDYCPN